MDLSAITLHTRSRRKTRRAPSSTRCWPGSTRRPGRPHARADRRVGTVGRRRQQSAGGGVEPLVLASRAMDAEAAEQEYTDLFIGVGEGEMRPARVVLDRRGDRGTAAGRRSRRPGPARPRAPRRLVRSTKTTWRALCETMRILIAGTDDRRPGPTSATQRAFFETPDRRLGRSIAAMQYRKVQLPITTGG